MIDLQTQMHTYFEETSLPVDVDELIREFTDTGHTVSSIEFAPMRRLRPSPVFVVVVASLLTLLVIGAFGITGVLSGDTPVVTQPPTVPTTLPTPTVTTVPTPTVTTVPTPIVTPTTTSAPTTIAVEANGPFETFTGFGCVYDLEVAADGAVWAACGSSGLRRFDGVEWSFPFEDSPQGIFDVAFTGDGTLVAAGRSEDGNGFLSFYTGGEWHSLNVPNVLAIEAHPDGTVWAAASGTGETPLMRLDQDGWNQVPGTFGLGLAISPDGAVWSIHPSGGGLFRWDGTQTKIGDGAEFVWSAPDGTIWITGAAEAFGDWTVARYNDHEWTDVPELRSARILDMAFPDDGTVWAVASDFAEYAGAYQYDGTTWTRYTTEDGLPTISLSAVAAAPDGSVWFGTSSGRIVRFTPPA